LRRASFEQDRFSGEFSITNLPTNITDSLTAVTTAKIIEQTGFKSDEVKQALAVEGHLQITHSSRRIAGGTANRELTA